MYFLDQKGISIPPKVSKISEKAFIIKSLQIIEISEDSKLESIQYIQFFFFFFFFFLISTHKIFPAFIKKSQHFERYTAVISLKLNI